MFNHKPKNRGTYRIANYTFATSTNNGSLTATKNLEIIKAFPLRLETQNSAFGNAQNYLKTL